MRPRGGQRGGRCAAWRAACHAARPRRSRRLTRLADKAEVFIDKSAGSIDKDSDEYNNLVSEAKSIGSDYLAMEKFVNLNYMGERQVDDVGEMTSGRAAPAFRPLYA